MYATHEKVSPIALAKIENAGGTCWFGVGAGAGPEFEPSILLLPFLYMRVFEDRAKLPSLDECTFGDTLIETGSPYLSCFLLMNTSPKLG